MSLGLEELIKSLNDLLPETYRATPSDESVHILKVDGGGPDRDMSSIVLDVQTAVFVVMLLHYKNQEFMRAKREILEEGLEYRDKADELLENLRKKCEEN